MIPRFIKYLKRHQLLALFLLSITINLMQLNAFIHRCEDNAVLNYQMVQLENTNDSLRMADIKYYTVSE